MIDVLLAQFLVVERRVRGHADERQLQPAVAIDDEGEDPNLVALMPTLQGRIGGAMPEPPREVVARVGPRQDRFDGGDDARRLFLRKVS